LLKFLHPIRFFFQIEVLIFPITPLFIAFFVPLAQQFFFFPQECRRLWKGGGMIAENHWNTK
jgi:hypothetical protein